MGELVNGDYLQIIIKPTVGVKQRVGNVWTPIGNNDTMFAMRWLHSQHIGCKNCDPCNGITFVAYFDIDLPS
jgi:hypothetical protein